MSWIEQFVVGVAVFVSATALLAILRWIGFKPVVKLFSLARRCIGWTWSRLSSVVWRLVPTGKEDSLLARQMRMNWLQDQIRNHEVLIHENRWLTLELRRDTYVRTCRELAPNIHVDEDREPKVLVWIRDSNKPEYSWLTPSDEKNKWATHPDLSRRLSDLFEEGSDVSLRVVLPNGLADLEIKPQHVSYVPYADNTHRAILTLEPSPGLYSVVDEMNATILLLGRMGWPAAALAKESRLILPNE